MRPLSKVAFAAVLTLLLAVSAGAGEFSVGAGIGIVKPKEDSAGVETDIESTTYLTGNLRIGIFRNVYLEPEVAYWKVTSPAGRGELDLEDLTLGANLLIAFPADPVRLWAGAGVGAHRMSGILVVDQVGSNTDPDSEVGYHFLAGLDYDIGERLSIFGAARYDRVSLSEDENLKERKLYGGLRLRF